MTTKTLRALAKDYANGVLNKENYRKERDAYLKAVVAGSVKVEPIEFRPPVEIQDLDITMEKSGLRPQRADSDDITAIVPPTGSRPLPQHTPAREPARQPANSPLLLITVVLLIIAAIGVSIALLRSSGKTARGPEESTVQAQTGNLAEESQAESMDSQPASPAEILIKNFLEENNWSEDNLQQFRNDWQALTAIEQEQGLTSPMRMQLVNAIHKKLLEERALLGLGDTEEVVARQHKLVDFAADLNINDPRLRVKGDPVNESYSPQPE